MGIPGLSESLRRYRRTRQVGCSRLDCSENSQWEERGYLSDSPLIEILPLHVVIDGPSLVYWRCRELPPAEDAIGGQTEYSRLAADVVKFLEELEDGRFVVHALYFDGGLPIFKRSVRMDRLKRLVSKLVRLRARNLEGLPVSVLSGADASDQGPAPAFIVPAVVEALRSNPRWRERVLVTPGEADPYIAADAREPLAATGSKCVLSNDSDLAVNDLGPALLVTFDAIRYQTCRQPECRRRGEMAFFIDAFSQMAQWCTSYTSGFCDPDSWHGLISKKWVEAIFVSAECDDLSDLMEYFGSAVEGASKTSIMDALQRDPLRLASLKAFEEEHAAKVDLTTIQELPAWQVAMDNRLCELAQQLTGGKDLNMFTHIYLQPLLEDPERTSAWVPSRDIRALAYRIMAKRTEAPQQSLREFVRSGDHVHYAVISLKESTESQCDRELTALQATVVDFTREYEGSTPSSTGHTSKSFIWILFAAVMSYEWYLKMNKQVPSRREIAAVFRRPENSSGRAESFSWPSIHFMAVTHAYLYSLRMLQQVLCIPGQGQESDGFHLFAELRDLPAIVNLIRQPHQFGVPWNDLANCVIDMTQNLQLFNAENSEEDERTENVRDLSKRAASSSTSNNPFDLLSME